MKLQIPQLIAVASQVGFIGDDLATAVSIALAESGGNPQAYNPEKAAGTPQGYGSFGLWQIYLKAHPEYAGQNLFDPLTNAAAAFAVYRAAGNSFQPWSTFLHGNYLAYVDSVNQAISTAQDALALNPTPADAGTANAGSEGTSASTDGSSSTPPGTGELVTLAVGGALALWAAFRFFG